MHLGTFLYLRFTVSTLSKVFAVRWHYYLYHHSTTMFLYVLLNISFIRKFCLWPHTKQLSKLYNNRQTHLSCGLLGTFDIGGGFHNSLLGTNFLLVSFIYLKLKSNVSGLCWMTHSSISRRLRLPEVIFDLSHSNKNLPLFLMDQVHWITARLILTNRLILYSLSFNHSNRLSSKSSLLPATCIHCSSNPSISPDVLRSVPYLHYEL